MRRWMDGIKKWLMGSEDGFEIRRLLEKEFSVPTLRRSRDGYETGSFSALLGR